MSVWGTNGRPFMANEAAVCVDCLHQLPRRVKYPHQLPGPCRCDCHVRAVPTRLSVFRTESERIRSERIRSDLEDGHPGE